MSMQIEELDGVLWMTGHLHPNEEQAFQRLLNDYLHAGAHVPRILEMSGVGYMSTAAVRVLVNEIEQTHGHATIRSSIPIIRTLNAIGAPDWLKIEPCRTPNRKARTTAVGQIQPPPPATAPASRVGSTVTPPGTSDLPRPLPSEEDHPTPAKAMPPAAPLVDKDEDIPDDWSVLRTLMATRTYSFQMPGLPSEVTGRIVCRIGGPWILIETHGARRLVNVSRAGVIDILS